MNVQSSGVCQKHEFLDNLIRKRKCARNFKSIIKSEQSLRWIWLNGSTFKVLSANILKLIFLLLNKFPKYSCAFKIPSAKCLTNFQCLQWFKIPQSLTLKLPFLHLNHKTQRFLMLKHIFEPQSPPFFPLSLLQPTKNPKTSKEKKKNLSTENCIQ